MNQPVDEQLSALMDGEVARDQMRFLLKRVETDRGLPVRWERYHVARQVLRRQEIGVSFPGFADAVMARLDEEVFVEARQPAAWLRWGTGGAIAASVAVAALVLTRPTGDPANLGAGTTMARTASTALASPSSVAASTVTALPSNFRPPLLAPNGPVDTAPVSFGSDLSQPIGSDPRLQPYVNRQYQTLGPNGQSAVVPYLLTTRPQHEDSSARQDR